eukprot:7383740-Prymnesium_polylepis.2
MLAAFLLVSATTSAAVMAPFITALKALTASLSDGAGAKLSDDEDCQEDCQKRPELIRGKTRRVRLSSSALASRLRLFATALPSCSVCDDLNEDLFNGCSTP